LVYRPEYYGTELVSLLSQMLNQCVDGRQSLAASFALQAITALCQADIVDIVTTWRVIAPKLNKDYRVDVLVRFGTLADYLKLQFCLRVRLECWQKYATDHLPLLGQ
jgi:hypothetical protein